MTDVSVVIVNYNAGEALGTTLASLPAGLDGLEWEGVVVDNDSRDGSEQAAENGGPRVRLLRVGANLGFARGVNAGIAATRAAVVLILNPDCALDAGAGALLRAELLRWPDCALVGPRILDPDGTLQDSARGDPSLMTGIFGRTGALSRLLPGLSIVRKNLMSHDAVHSGVSSTVVDWVSGACMVARREALSQVRGFDEHYFLYWEDADLCRRLRAVNWHTRYVPAAVVRHRVGQSSRTAPRLANREFHKSAYRYYVTHVVPQPWHPGRALAWTILTTRSAIKSFGRS
ncbi:MAG: glycosyltransferase family 2 protein [Acidobacteria bacterium]|nr:glycosyltransferase family 2 protein [Acidobacteriota bacterium]